MNKKLNTQCIKMLFKPMMERLYHQEDRMGGFYEILRMFRLIKQKH